MDNIIERALDLSPILARKSVFLFGPRQTGKSTYLAHKYPDSPCYSLLQAGTYLDFSRDPARLGRELAVADVAGRPVIIDEIQKLPALLDEIHLLIEKQRIKFILTGSSARKLRKAGVNLLGGRAAKVTFHPLTHRELGGEFDLDRALQYGTIPSVWRSAQPWEDLKDYVDTYLREEIMAEGLSRNLPVFSRFLETAALCSGQMINFAKIGSDAQVAHTTAYEYFQILKDTLIAYEVPPFRRTVKRKAIATAKYYFFDNGVTRYLQGRDRLTRQDADFGTALESYCHHELKSFADYHRLPEVYYWRSASGFEVDFILNGNIAIEIKSTRHVNAHDLRGLKALAEEKMMRDYLLVSLDKGRQVWDGVTCLPIEDFLRELWAGKYLLL